MKKEEQDNLSWSGFIHWAPKKILLSSLFYGSIRILFATAWPYLLYHYLQKRDFTFNAAAGQILAIIFLLFILSALATHRQSVLNIKLVDGFSHALYQKLWEKMLAIKWLSFHRKSRVYFIDIFMNEAWRLRKGITALLESIVVNLILVAALMLLVFLSSKLMFLLCIFSLGISGALHLYSSYKLRPLVQHFHQAWRNQHHWSSTLTDQFDLLKMDRGHAFSRVQNENNTAAFLGSNSAMLKDQSKWNSINLLVNNLLRLLVFLLGMYWVQQQQILFADFLFILLIVSMIQTNLNQVPTAIYTSIESKEASNRIREFFAMDTDLAAQNNIKPLPNIHSISITDLRFAYSSQNVVKNPAIHLQKGKLYLWQGANGSGKSTTAHVLMGLLEPDSGNLTVNGAACSWQELKAYQHRFAFVHQEAPMFIGTLQENILFGHPEPARAWQQLQHSWLHPLLPSGQNAESRTIGEHGEGLSGGEARRLALIREWLRDSELIILDEPLNHLDEYSITELRREIVNIKHNAIVIIISHQTGFETLADEIRRF
ncbi:ABC transporter ATP-binding protein/permease [Pedobacter sp. MC2016-14]|uniref:ATP-binding cassette domain-containing protein n=1 Tax=Pedobacter sp. MC2016-14 TaxID=2897327 RepID=UPI001E46C1C4|nr:ABC transporter ATP-binding protein [Pedobacter sp. MC2016-14]MCD0486845.1 ABC transporter ATP-binding protein/permease [Pedobacter sp. MC2016-14]